jgi:hypothetical protein
MTSRLSVFSVAVEGIAYLIARAASGRDAKKILAAVCQRPVAAGHQIG